MSIRAFLAIDLNEIVREALDQFQEQVDLILPIKWVAASSMHLTVKFLGDIDEGQVLVLQEALRKGVKNMSPFSLTINGLGGFPSLQRPRILWVGVSGEVEPLQVLVSSVESTLRPLGFTQEGKPFHPHLTLSRIKSHSREIGKFLETSDLCRKEWRFGELTVDRLCLFQSQLSAKRAKYSLLWSLPFNGNTSTLIDKKRA